MSDEERVQIVEELPRGEGEETLVICMSGSAEQANAQPAVDGQCGGCGRAIHFMATLPTWVTKLCLGCVWKRAKENPEEFAKTQLKVSETTIQETLEAIGLPDTPETRDVITTVSRERFIEWLKKGAEDAEGCEEATGAEDR